MIDLRSWLELAAMLLLLLEILERRTGALSVIPASLKFRRTPRGAPLRETKERADAAQPPRSAQPPATPAPPLPPLSAGAPTSPSSPTALGDALKRARQRAKDRTGG